MTPIPPEEYSSLGEAGAKCILPSENSDFVDYSWFLNLEIGSFLSTLDSVDFNF